MNNVTNKQLGTLGKTMSAKQYQTYLQKKLMECDPNNVEHHKSQSISELRQSVQKCMNKQKTNNRTMKYYDHRKPNSMVRSNAVKTTSSNINIEQSRKNIQKDDRVIKKMKVQKISHTPEHEPVKKIKGLA